MALCHFVEGLTYMKDVRGLYDDLGRRDGPVMELQRALAERCSGTVAIDGHVVGSRSRLNDLASKGYKFPRLGEPQVNLLMALDAKSGRPICSRFYEGRATDRLAVRDLLRQVPFSGVIFLVDRGLDGDENAGILTERGNHYVFPLDSSDARCKEATSDLELMCGHKVTPEKTVVFFDEVQEAQNLVTLSKYLVEDGRFRLVMSGSMLGVELRQVRSFPVGFLHIETMFPLDFEEFYQNQGMTDSLWNRMQAHFEQMRPMEPALHERLLRLFRLFIVVGGMPAAVQTYIDSAGDLGAVRDVQRDLVRLYRVDISKYAGARTLQVMAIFDDIPSQLDKENKRFELKSLRKKATYERYANDFQWLVSSRAALKTVSVREPKAMLRRTEEPNRFKLYQSDTGLLVSRYPLTVSMAIISGSKDVNRGGIYENVVAQELASARVALRYHRHSSRGEVDFIGETPDREVVPMEVKSGKSYKRYVALNNLLSVEDHGVQTAYVLSEANVSVEDRMGKPVRYVPLYLMPFVARTLVSEDAGSGDELARMGLDARRLVVPPPDLSALA